jgi:hypothetical protein
MYMIPMSFWELDQARLTAAASTASGKREKKRKTATIARLNPEVSVTGPNVEEASDDLRTGRWTADEVLYCDKLVEKFESGELPVANGIKLNDFLSSMLKSKQSRLTKKMKNAKLSARAYSRTTGYVVDINEARVLSELENAFYRSIPCSMEKAEIRFHVQKEWREIFSAHCVQMGQKLEADDWLSSVEEMDRRASRAKDAAKMARRKRMMGYALQQDQMHPLEGVFIETSKATPNAEQPDPTETEVESASEQRHKRLRGLAGSIVPKKSRVQPPPFLGRLLTYMQRHFIPFEYIDAWVPSFVSGNQEVHPGAAQNCRLCFAGCVTAEMQVAPDGRGMIPLPKEDQFDLNAFGEYSQKFSFDVGCGLPGRVYHTGIPSWEQFVQNAPVGHFERSGGAVQWGVKTVLGIPVPSPNVGRIVVLFYSRHDRPQNQDMAARIVDEMTKLMPSPKWKLVVDVGLPPPAPVAESAVQHSANKEPETTQGVVGPKTEGLLKLLTELMPTSMTSPLSPYLPGFTSLRMMLLKSTKTQHETELINCIVQSYESYLSTGRPQADIAVLVVRDFLALSQESVHQNISALAPAVAPQQEYQHYQPQRHQQVQQFRHAQLGGLANSVDFTRGMEISMEPTPVSQMRAMPGMPPQQQQGRVSAQHAYDQATSTQGNVGSIQPYVVFNAK